MNNIHDMGGMQGFGAIPIEENEPVFHSEWEAKAMAITVAMGAWGRWNIDASRHARERLAPQEYLNLTYYERWIAALADLMVDRGLVTVSELQSGKPDGGATTAQPPLTADKVAAVLARGGPVLREIDTAPRFKIGDSVRTARDNPDGHTRLPRYARGRQGVITLHHGAHVFPDSNAKGLGEAPQHLYAVTFNATELWGRHASAKDSVTLDAWESYLEPA
ncbi:nitrile hydratase subunit beta [Limibacillus halophilus]|uniref:Nitrile hydratase subunit beta n=1 Tax=Limibacillus halophilus TaxID=1579333 RepID=A0A839STC1_9PROT|nr:nitrile hydratase subunit beta [Limibacillus halophilus]MBB3064960.1 nitrile hydratase [Limibacillus halophilus]